MYVFTFLLCSVLLADALAFRILFPQVWHLRSRSDDRKLENNEFDDDIDEHFSKFDD